MLFSPQKLAMALGVDLSRINPNSSDFDQKLEMANQLVINWMKVPENWQYLQEKKAAYIHDKGWTYYNGKKGNLKQEADIPQEAFIMLPPEIRNNTKELMKWVEKYHPYLLHRKVA